MYEYKQQRPQRQHLHETYTPPANIAPKVIAILVILGATFLLDLLPNNTFHDPFNYLSNSSSKNTVGLNVPEDYINEVGVAITRSDTYHNQLKKDRESNDVFHTANSFIGFIKGSLSDAIVSNPDYFKKNMAVLSPENLAEIQSFSTEISNEITKRSPVTVKEAQQDLKHNGAQYNLENLIQDAETIQPY